MKKKSSVGFLSSSPTVTSESDFWFDGGRLERGNGGLISSGSSSSSLSSSLLVTTPTGGLMSMKSSGSGFSVLILLDV